MKAVMQYRELTFVVVVGDMVWREIQHPHLLTRPYVPLIIIKMSQIRSIIKPQKSPSSLFSWLAATQLLNTFSALIIWNLWLIHNEQSIKNEFQEAYPSPEWHPVRGMRFQGFCRQ
jgi:hypothetical protein